MTAYCERIAPLTLCTFFVLKTVFLNRMGEQIRPHNAWTTSPSFGPESRRHPVALERTRLLVELPKPDIAHRDFARLALNLEADKSRLVIG
jgi:hypothetical protein